MSVLGNPQQHALLHEQNRSEVDLCDAEFNPPQPDELEAAKGASRRLKAAVLVEFRRAAREIQNTQENEGAREVDRALSKQAFQEMQEELRGAATLTELERVLVRWCGEEELTRIGAVQQDIEYVREFANRIRAGWRESGDSGVQQLDHRHESYQMVLSALKEFPRSIHKSREELAQIFGAESERRVAAGKKQTEKLNENVELDASEELVKGAGKGLGGLLHEQGKSLSDRAKQGGKVMLHTVALPVIGSAALLRTAGKGLHELKDLLIEAAGRLGLIDGFNRIRRSGSEAGERAGPGKVSLPFDLHLPIPTLPGFGGGTETEDEGSRMGLSHTQHRNSQVGLQPLYDEGDEIFGLAGSGGGGIELGGLLSGVRANLLKAQIRSNDYSFGHVLHNTEAWVVTGKDGSLQSLDSYVKQCARRHTSETAPTLKDLYPGRIVENHEESEHRVVLPGETEVSTRVYPGSTLTLPLAPGYTVRKVSFLDRKDRPIVQEQGWKLREGIFGSFKIRSPENAHRIRYLVAKKTPEEAKIPESLIAKLQNILPEHKTFHSTEEQVFRKALETLPDPADRTTLWYQKQKQSGFIYTMDPFLSRYQKGAGTARLEAIAGTKMGICDSFAFYVASEMTSLGVPGLVLSGPVVKDKSFSYNPGHAVAATAESGGIRELDLTKEAGSDGAVSRWKIDFSDRREILGELRSGEATNRDVLSRASELRYRLQGEQPPELHSDDTEELSAIERVLHKWDRYGSDEVSERPYLQGAGYKESPELESKLKGVSVLSQKWALGSLYREAGESGTLGPMYRYFYEHGKAKQITEDDLRVLPPSYETLTEYDGALDLARYTRKAVVQDGVGEQAQQEAIQWLLEETTPHEKRGRFHSADHWVASISPRQLFAVVDEESVKKFSLEQLEKLSEHLGVLTEEIASVSVRFHDSETWFFDEAGGRDYNRCIEGLQEALSAVVQERVARGGRIRFTEARELALASMSTSAAVLSARDPKGAPGKHARCANRSMELLRTLEQGAGLKPGELPLQLLREEGNTFGAILEKVSGEADSRLKHRGADFSDAAAAILLREGGFGDWLAVPFWCERLGFSIDLSEKQARFQDGALEWLAGELAQTPEEETATGRALNWPDEGEYAASAVLARLSQSHQARTLRNCRALVEIGAVREESFQRLWPEALEEQAASELLSGVQTGAHRNNTFTLEGSPCPLRYATPLSKLTTLHRAFLDGRTGVEQVLALADHYTPPSSDLDKLLARVRDHHPSAWKELVSSRKKQVSYDRSISGSEEMALSSTAARLLRGVRTPEIYHALQWLGCERIGEGRDSDGQQSEVIFPSSQEELSKLVEAASEGDDALREVIERRGISRSVRARVVNETSNQAKAALLALSAVTAPREAYAMIGAVEKLPSEGVRMLSWEMKDDGRPKLKQLWSAVTRTPYSEGDFTESYERAVEGVDTATRHDHPKFSTPYSRYLLGQRAPVLPRSSSGDFEEFTQYKPGEDISRLDHKASARSGKLLTRKYREREFRPVKLVIDPEWLLEEAETPGYKQKRFNRERVEEVFRHLLLAEREGVPVDMVILSRAGSERMTDLHKSKEHHEEKFRKRLAHAVEQFAELSVKENAMYGDTGGIGYNLLSGEGDFGKGSLIVCAFSRANRSESEGALQALRRRGCFIHMLRA